MLGVVDTCFVSKLGTDDIAGVGITNLIMNLYIAFFIAIGMGTTAIVSRNIGAGDNKAANHSVKQSIIMASAIGLISGIINLLFSTPTKGQRLVRWQRGHESLSLCLLCIGFVINYNSF